MDGSGGLLVSWLGMGIRDERGAEPFLLAVLDLTLCLGCCVWGA